MSPGSHTATFTLNTHDDNCAVWQQYSCSTAKSGCRHCEAAAAAAAAKAAGLAAAVGESAGNRGLPGT